MRNGSTSITAERDRKGYVTKHVKQITALRDVTLRKLQVTRQNEFKLRQISSNQVNNIIAQKATA
jgi:hypothetical protein